MLREFRMLPYAAMVCIMLLSGCNEDPASPTVRCLDQCEISTYSLSFGNVIIGESSELTFVIKNACSSVLTGTLSEACDQFSIVGGATYNLSAGDSAEFTVRYSPISEGSHICAIDTGNHGCADILCDGVGMRVVVLREDFDDGNHDGWPDHHVCSDINPYWFAVIYSNRDSSWVLKHEGGTEYGGGNGAAYVYSGVYLDDMSVTADIRDTLAYHETAKAMGLSACLDPATGAQYMAWYTVDGIVFLYEPSSWLSCGPVFLAKTEIDPIEVGEEFQMSLSVKNGLIAIRVNGEEVLSYDDSASPLPPGTVGLVATAGITYFDNVVVTKGSL